METINRANCLSSLNKLCDNGKTKESTLLLSSTLQNNETVKKETPSSLLLASTLQNNKKASLSLSASTSSLGTEKKTNKNQVIDDNGNSCFSSVQVLEAGLNITVPVPSTVFKVKSAILKARGDRKNKEKIADVSDTIYAICYKPEGSFVFKVKSDFRTRNQVLWRRPGEDILPHMELIGEEVLSLVATQRGEFGPRKSRSGCFFVPFGEFHKTAIGTGVWISTKYYESVMKHQADAISGSSIRRVECLLKTDPPKPTFEPKIEKPQDCEIDCPDVIRDSGGEIDFDGDNDEKKPQMRNSDLYNILLFEVSLLEPNPDMKENVAILKNYLKEMENE